VKLRRPKRPPQDERRRDLLEQNLMAEHGPKVAQPKRGCVLPFIGIGLAVLGACFALGGLVS
jgi:hypothetical protein